MRFHELLTEAVYHNLANALKRALPDKSAEIDAELAWAEQSLKRPDRINWYMLVVKNYFNNTLQQVQGNYDFTSLDQLHHDLIHFYGFNAPSIEAYAYKSQNIGELIGALDQLLKKHEEAERNKPKPVTPQTGDHVLFDFGGGVQWWFVDRGYCRDEGRSGKHCGNVVGQRKTDQRLLSLRKDGHVLLTFVLEPDGALGEMKARGNQKPAEKYHPQIIRLLMWDQVKGISGMGYLPDANFSMFDLSEKNLAYMDAHKPKLIADQCRITPIEILRAPESIQEKYRQHIMNPAIQRLVDDSSTDNWDDAVAWDPDLILYAPHDIPGFEKRLLKYCSNAKRDILLKAPNSIARNPELLNKIVAEDGYLIAGVNPSVRGYPELCKTAVANEPDAIKVIPEESRNKDLYLSIVKRNGMQLYWMVPDKFKDTEMCLAAVHENGKALEYVPAEIIDRNICLTAIKSRSGILQLVPKKLRDSEICMIAIKAESWDINYVPDDILDKKMCWTAIKNDADTLSQISDHMIDPEMCQFAVERKASLNYVPEQLRDRKLCMTAVSLNGHQLHWVPKEFQDRDMCMTAVKQSGYALGYVPEQLRDRAMCWTAVKMDRRSLEYVPEKLRDRSMCMAAVKQDGHAIRYVPKQLRDRDLYIAAVRQDIAVIHNLASLPMEMRMDIMQNL